MASTLIINSRIVNEGRIIEGDVKIADGRIIKIGGEIRADNCRIIDADGRFLLPGMIDDQVHFRQPGLTHKGDIASESRAAVAGGITSFMEMPNTIPPTLTMAEVEKKRRLAAENSRANFAFYLGASDGNLEDIKAASPARIAGLKVFMGASTGNMLVDDEAILSAIFAASPTLIATHCEKMPVIEKNLAAFAGEFSPSSHPQIRNAKACFESSSQAIDLAKKFGARLHILHISTKEELPLFSSDALAGKKITAEACVNHLYFCDEDYESLGNLIKCNPAIKSREDRAAIRAAVAEGRIDVVATDHAPHTLAEKNRPYLNAAAGLPTAPACNADALGNGRRRRFGFADSRPSGISQRRRFVCDSGKRIHSGRIFRRPRFSGFGNADGNPTRIDSGEMRLVAAGRKDAAVVGANGICQWRNRLR